MKKLPDVNSITIQELNEIIRQWDANLHLSQKLPLWRLKHSVHKFNSQWLELFQYSLLYFIVNSLPWTLSQVRQEQSLQLNYLMKNAYTLITINSPFSNEQFQLHLVLITKLITIFFAQNLPSLQINMQLQSEIYIFLIKVLFGTQVNENTYKIVINGLKLKKKVSKDRDSVDQIQQQVNLKKSTFVRRYAKNEDNFNLTQGQKQLMTFKKCLKQSLYVRPHIQKKCQKISIKQFQQQQNKTKTQIFKSQSNSLSKPKNLMSNQISSALKATTKLELNKLKQFTIHCTPQKLNLYHPFQSKTIPIQKSTRYSLSQEVSVQDGQLKNWQSKIKEMKNQLYAGVKNELKKYSQIIDEQPNIPTIIAPIETKPRVSSRKILQQIQQQKQVKYEVIKFRKLNIENSPNLIMLDESEVFAVDQGQNEVLIKSSHKINKSLEKQKKNKNMHFLLPQI